MAWPALLHHPERPAAALRWLMWRRRPCCDGCLRGIARTLPSFRLRPDESSSRSPEPCRFMRIFPDPTEKSPATVFCLPVPKADHVGRARPNGNTGQRQMKLLALVSQFQPASLESGIPRKVIKAVPHHPTDHRTRGTVARRREKLRARRVRNVPGHQGGWTGRSWWKG